MLKVSKEKGRESGFLMNLIRDMLQEAAGTWTRRRKNHACACASLFTADVHLLSQVSLHNFPLSLIWCLMLKHWAVNKSGVFFSFFSILFPLHLIYKLSHCKEMTISTVNLFFCMSFFIPKRDLYPFSIIGWAKRNWQSTTGTSFLGSEELWVRDEKNVEKRPSFPLHVMFH